MILPVEQASKDIFERLGLGRFSNLAIVATELNSVNVDAIATVETDDDDYTIQPLLVIVNERLFAVLKDPKGD